jgi:hypothetical protein
MRRSAAPLQRRGGGEAAATTALDERVQTTILRP